MASSQEFPNTDDMSVFVAFHVPTDQAVAAAIVRLDAMMHEIFGDTQVREITSPTGLAHHEVIYRVQKPLLQSPEAMHEFFDGFAMIFNSASPMRPHFTQISEETPKGDNQ